MLDLRALEGRIKVTFKDPYWAHQAFVHRSYLYENQDSVLASNERLEFLGDAFIGYVVAYHLFQQFPEMSEGDLTRLRAALVQRSALFRVASDLDLGQHLYLGRGEDKSGGRHKAGNLASTYEALVGAVLLDGGSKRAEGFVLRSLGPYIDKLKKEALVVDFKSQLQELAQGQGLGAPRYRVVQEKGPAHDKEFTVEVTVGEDVLGSGSGTSKQAGEKEAARIAVGLLISKRER